MPRALAVEVASSNVCPTPRSPAGGVQLATAARQVQRVVGWRLYGGAAPVCRSTSFDSLTTAASVLGRDDTAASA